MPSVNKTSKKNIVWMVCKDPGGTAGIIPVADILIKRGYTVCLFADGKAIELLSDYQRDFISCNSLDDMMQIYIHQKPDVFVTSMCSGGGVGRDAIPFFRGKCPIIALQDTYGARLLTDWIDPVFRPDYICVNDIVGARIVRDAWPDFIEKNIIITGYPAMDKYAYADIGATRFKVLTALGINDSKPIILYCGQVARSGEVLKELVTALNEIEHDFYFIPRQHARMLDDAPDQARFWNDALQNFQRGVLVHNTTFLTTAELIMAATVVVSMYSTVLTECAILRRPNIALLYADIGMQQFISDTGGLMKEFPLVSLGCTAKATSRPELIKYISNAVSGELNLEKQQSAHFLTDGKNTERVADLINVVTRLTL